MSTLTATSTIGTQVIQIHATGCKHAIDPDRIVGIGDTIERAFASGLSLCDPDNDWPGWTMKVSPCARKVGTA